MPWWFHLAQKVRPSETARRPCPGHDNSQVFEKLGPAPLFSFSRCLVLVRVPASKRKRARSPGSLQVIWCWVERTQQYGAICAPELSYCGMQPGSCGPANDAVAALSASAAPNPRAPRYLMTRVFMVVLHSSECVKAEEREGVVRSAAAPSRGSAVTQVFLAIARHLPVMMRAGRSGNAGQCSHGQSKRQYDFGRHVHLLLPCWPRNRWRTPGSVSAETSLLDPHSFQSSDGLTICAASCSQLRRMQRQRSHAAQ